MKMLLLYIDELFYCEWMNELMTFAYPYSHRLMWTHREVATLKRNAYNEI